MAITTTYLMGSQYPIMSYEQYNKLPVSIPYSFNCNKGNTHLFYFGANHSWDHQDMQYPLLEEFWHNFLEITRGKNCVVLVEGSLRNLYDAQTKEQAIARGGAEGGFITFFANKNDIIIECPEPNKEWLRVVVLTP